MGLTAKQQYSNYLSSHGTVTLIRVADTSVGRIAPKKSVIGTLFGSFGYKSLRTPTVDIQTRFGHTLSYSKKMLKIACFCKKNKKIFKLQILPLIFCYLVRLFPKNPTHNMCNDRSYRHQWLDQHGATKKKKIFPNLK